MSDSPLTRPSLLIRLHDPQSDQAWNDFVQIYAPLIHGYCRRRELQDADAADVAQEVLRTVARTIQRFKYDPSRGKFRGWLLTVTRSKLNNFLNERRRQPAPENDTALLRRLGESPSPEEEADWDRSHRRRLFEWAAERVRTEVQPKTWDAFWKSAMDGIPGEEVAAQLGMSPGAVYVARSRVTARLREWIESIGDDPPDLEGISP